jgi:glucose/arabinose dehydrogenase
MECFKSIQGFIFLAWVSILHGSKEPLAPTVIFETNVVQIRFAKMFSKLIFVCQHHTALRRYDKGNVFSHVLSFSDFKLFRYLLVMLGLLIAFASHAQDCSPISETPPNIQLELVADGFDLPLYVTSSAEDSRLYVLERGGLVKIIENQKVLVEPFIDVRDAIGLEGEMGLLSLAFHPDYADNARVFALFTRQNPFDTVVAEFQRDPENPDRTLSAWKVILSAPQNEASIVHRGGQLAFLGNDLYVSIGDGAFSTPAQDDNDFRGKMLRLNVDDDEIPVSLFAKGLRNPWRFSVDACDERIYLADLGTTRFEELNVIEENGNYGWPYFESYECIELGQEMDCNSDGMTFPIYAYPHISKDTEGGSGIIGGYVYRGQALPELQGFYIFADLKGVLWALREMDGQWFRWELAQPGGGIVSLGQDAEGEVYIVNMGSGAIYKIVPTP